MSASPEARNLAVAALLFHAAALDGEIDQAEEQVIGSLLAKRFELSAGDLISLLDDARKAEEDANQILRFTQQIKDGSSHEERVALLEMLWEVVFADGEEHAFEANLMRRVAGLIYVTDQESGSARLRVRARLGLI
ncbi:MAG: TerB family tellurite resistance protein [Proteobacteria bacterium]|nr:TerB family tellurite resistance protein [Pseudomonadota bacterium]MDA1057448.1 TerB family tellurite resistance protein [Pseudomonadota bacterium]